MVWKSLLGFSSQGSVVVKVAMNGMVQVTVGRNRGISNDFNVSATVLAEKFRHKSNLIRRV